MRLVLQVGVLLLIFQNIIFAESYFFEDNESKAILSQLTNEAKKQVRKNEVKKTISYKLSGILFINSTNWVVWINDKPYNAVGKYSDFSINHVSNHSVHLIFESGNSILLTLDTKD